MAAKLDGRVLAAGSLLVAAIGSALAPAAGGPVSLVLGLSIAAIGIGATFVTAFSAALAGVDPHEAGSRSGIVNTFHELGGALGVAVLSSIAAGGMTTAGTSGGFQHAFIISAVAAAATAILASLVVSRRIGVSGGAPHMH